MKGFQKDLKTIHIGIRNIQDDNNYMKEPIKLVSKLILILFEIIYILGLFATLMLYLFLTNSYKGIILTLIIFIIYMFSIKKLKQHNWFIIFEKILKTIIFFMIFTLINFIVVFYYNQNYYDIHPDKSIKISLSDGNYDVMCENKLFNQPLLSYRYHTPKSNLFLPTLGIRYKETYEEERGIVVVYEKHSYFNLYVGDGRVLCSTMETLE